MKLRSVRLAVRVSPEELARIRSFAERWQVELSEYLRRRALGAPAPARRLPQVSVETLRQLARLGNNFNQALVLVYTNQLDADLLPMIEEILVLLRSITVTLTQVEEPGGER